MKNQNTAMPRGERTRRLVLMAMLTAIIVILQFTPLGYIPIPGFNPTTMHIPVIIGAIMLGPWEGAFLGLVFGITSILQATIQVPLTAFLFSPFVPFGSYKSAIIAIVPRVLIGLFAGWTYRLVAKADRTGIAASGTAAVVGSFTNTVLVLGGIYFLFGNDYAAHFKMSISAVRAALMTIVGTSGIAEAIAAAVITVAVVKALRALEKHTVSRHR